MTRTEYKLLEAGETYLLNNDVKVHLDQGWSLWYGPCMVLLPESDGYAIVRYCQAVTRDS